MKTPSSYEYTVSFGQPRKMKGRVYFSPKELKHLVVAALLVGGVGLSYGVFSFGIPNWLFVFPPLAGVLLLSFLAHEIAHKVTAQRRGLWAEFRLTLWGAAMTLLFLILPVTFKVISPGAVMISGSAGIRDMGKISLAGPVTNIVLSTAFLSLAFIAPNGVAMVSLLSSFLNAFMAVLNLIPFGIFDGFKIFNWDKKAWAASFATSLALMITAYILWE